ncbi:MAG: type II secretion system protein [Desulfobacterales bacterium]|jgi:prepilin-type N-terminal cleavage/methylation domain-containing protein|nr:type II secretion system protein [Desulfobacterales bacterium]
MRAILKKNDQLAMTMLELIIALAVLASLSAVVLPWFFHTTLPRYRLKHAAQRLVCDMLYAKMRAAATNRQHRIIFDVHENTYRLESGDRSSQSTAWHSEAREGRFSDPQNDAYFPGVRIIAATQDQIIFSPTGAQTLMSITLAQARDQRIKISAAIAGQLRMERSN